MTKKTDYFPSIECCNIAILGLGYVGLPLAIEFAKSMKSAAIFQDFCEKKKNFAKKSRL